MPASPKVADTVNCGRQVAFPRAEIQDEDERGAKIRREGRQTQLRFAIRGGISFLPDRTSSRRDCTHEKQSARHEPMKIIKNAHFIVAVLLALFLMPAFHLAHLPLRFTWSAYFLTFFWSLFFQSMIMAIILFAIGYPSEFRRAISGTRGPKVNPGRALTSIVLPATYLFCVFILAFSYNDVIATIRFDGVYDALLNWMDSWLLGGATVADLSRRASNSQFKWFELTYFGMFPQVGACLFIVALREGRIRAMQFIGAIATAYFMGLAFFYLVPATGPYYLSALRHDGGYVGEGQMIFVNMLNSFVEHRRLSIIGTDYFIAFPCLHITQPLIVLWFMRGAKRIVAVLAAYDVVLILAILLLQQHYVVDLIGGACVALLAVAAVDWNALSGRQPTVSTATHSRAAASND